MPDVFISYKAEDRRRIQPLVQALQANEAVIDRAADLARVVHRGKQLGENAVLRQ